MSTTSVSNLLWRARARVRKIVGQTWLKATDPGMVSVQTLSDEAFLARFDVKGKAVTRETLLAHYGHRVTTAWPTPPSRLRTLDIDTDELGQEELVALADSILECRFVLGRTAGPEVTEEGKVAWLVNPTSDKEWLWDLNRHEWWPVLGHAYVQTGDERYAAAFVAQMLDWVKSCPPPARKNEQSPTWRLMEVALRMRTSWIPSFALFYESPSFSDQAKLTMLRAIYDHARFLYLFRTRNNHLLRESHGLAYLATCFPEFVDARHWRQTALARLDRALTEQINQDGSHFEVSTGYQSLVIDEFQKIHDLLQANDLSLPNESLASWLENMYHVIAYLVRPDGTFPQINDGWIFWDHSQIAQAGDAFGRDDFVYIGTGGRQGSRPKQTSVGFDNAGWYVMRSDWTTDARYLLFDAGPYGGHHGHEDKLSIEVLAFGQTYIVDPGTYTYDRADPSRAYFMSSQAHNTVLVDGKSQVRRWKEGNRYPKTGLVNHVTWISQPDFDYASGSYNDGYSSFSLDKPVDADIIRDVIHTRRILFVKPDYWVMVDELSASTVHDYHLLFHTPPEIVVRHGPECRVVLGTVPGATTLHLIPADPRNLRASFVTGSKDPIQGWYSPGSCQKAPATAVIYERENSASTVMVTLLYPCRGGQTGDEVKVESLAVSEGEGLALAVISGRGNDYLMFSNDGSLKRFGPYCSRARVAAVRTNRDGGISAQFEWKV
jgi:hypothetical protein